MSGEVPGKNEGGGLQVCGLGDVREMSMGEVRKRREKREKISSRSRHGETKWPL